MTIVAIMSGWHIEFHIGAAIAIAAQGTVAQDITLDKPGRFLYATVYVAGAANTFLLTSSFEHRNGSAVVHGDVVNNSGDTSQSLRFALGNASTAIAETAAQGGIVIAIQD